MTPEEWKAGMENEAASIDDLGWSERTRRAIVYQFWRDSAVQFGVQIGALAVLGFTLTALIDSAERFSMLSTVSEGPMELLSSIRFLEAFGLVFPALLSFVLCGLGFFRFAAIVGCGLSMLPMTLGLWLYVWMHDGLIHASTSGAAIMTPAIQLATVDRATFLVLTNVPRSVIPFGLVVFAAIAGHAVRSRWLNRPV